jgi:hypothetical protein
MAGCWFDCAGERNTTIAGDLATNALKVSLAGDNVSQLGTTCMTFQFMVPNVRTA